MYKRILAIALVLLLAASLFADNIFVGVTGSFAARGSFDKNDSGFQKNDDSVIAATLKPSFGMYLDEKNIIGVQTGFNYTHYNVNGSPDPLTLVSLVVGGDITISEAWKLRSSKEELHTFSVAVTPYYRYKVLSGIKGFDKIGAWLEVKMEYKQFFSLGAGVVTPSKAKLAARIHPIVTYQISEDLSLFTSADVFALKASCDIEKSETKTNTYTTKWKIGVDGMFSADTLAEAVLRIGVLKKFN